MANINVTIINDYEDDIFTQCSDYVIKDTANATQTLAAFVKIMRDNSFADVSIKKAISELNSAIMANDGNLETIFDYLFV